MVGEVALGALRRRVAAVEEGVHDDVADLLARRQLEAGLEVAHVAVHAAAGDQAHEVEAAAPAGRLGAGLARGPRFSKKLPSSIARLMRVRSW